jgi:hypothetical protein
MKMFQHEWITRFVEPTVGIWMLGRCYFKGDKLYHGKLEFVPSDYIKIKDVVCKDLNFKLVGMPLSK